MRILSASPARRTTMSRQASAPYKLENVSVRQCTAPARNIFAKQPLENAGTWQGERKQSRA